MTSGILNVFHLKNGKTVVINLLRADQFKEYYDFLNSLSADEKMYLKYDVSNVDFVKKRMESIDGGTRISVVGWDEDKNIVGSCTLYWSEFGWKRSVGKLRLIVSEKFRGLGLAIHLASIVFNKALEQNLYTISAEMMKENKRACHILGSIGLSEEAVIKDGIVDTKGKKHDLIIMTADLKKLVQKFKS